MLVYTSKFLHKPSHALQTGQSWLSGYNYSTGLLQKTPVQNFVQNNARLLL